MENLNNKELLKLEAIFNEKPEIKELLKIAKECSASDVLQADSYLKGRIEQ